MKILFINTFYAPHNVGGAEKSLSVIVEAMRNQGHEVVVLATCDTKGLHKETVNGIKVYRAGIKNQYWIYNNKIKHSFYSRLIWLIRDIYNSGMRTYVREVIKAEEPDLISCHNIRGWSISIWDEIKKNNVPVVQVLHDYYLMCRRVIRFNNGKACENRCIECRIIKSLHKIKSQNINAVVGVCDDILERHLKDGYFKSGIKTSIHNIRTIPNKVLVNDDDRESFVFGFIGALTEYKGVSWLIEQFKMIKNTNILLKIAGQGEEKYVNYLKNTAKDDNRIFFLGHTNSDSFYSQINVLVIPSIWFEPLASVAIEACANHVPVITSGMGGLKEIIIDNYNGLVCNYSEKDSLSDAIIKLSNDQLLYKKLKLSARESITPFMDINRLVSEYERIYFQLLNRN